MNRSIGEFAEPWALRLPRPGFILRRLLPRRQYAPAGEVLRLEPVLARYGMPPRGPLVVQRGGKRNEAWVLHNPRGRLLLKRYKTTLTRAQIVHEHSILEHLEAADFPAPRLVRDEAGSTLVEHEGRFYVIFDYLTGYARFDDYYYLPPQTHRLQTAVGRALGRLHNALNGFIPRGENINGFSSLTGERERDLNWYLARLERARAYADRLPGGDPMRALLEERGGWLGEQLQEISAGLTAANPERGIIHGDYGPNNMLFKPGAPLVVLDFELARLDWLLADVVAALSTTAVKVGTRADWTRILTGYLSERRIPPEQLCLLPQVWQFQALRRAILCGEQYLAQPRPALFQEATRRIRRAAWAAARHAELASLAELSERGRPAERIPAA